jgi:hypothetical protein
MLVSTNILAKTNQTRIPTMNQSTSRLLAGAGCTALLLAAACGAAAQEPQQPKASVTVFPVLVAGKASTDVANVVGIMLERGGLQQVELEEAAFLPAAQPELAAWAGAFGTFVQQRRLSTDLALFAEIRGTHKAGFEELLAVLVDRQGKVVWSERQAAGEPAWDRQKPHEPMDCCVLLAQRLRTPLQLADPLRADAPVGKLAARMQKAAGTPPQAELDAMAARLAALKQQGNKARILVLPPRTGDAWSADGASELAARLQRTGLVQARASAEPIRFQAEAGTNEQRTLWSAARSIQQAVRQRAAQPDYLLFTDFLIEGDGPVVAVHSFVLSPAGEWVVVDYQNSHHADFTRIAPTSAAGCIELAAARVAGCLRP